MIITIIFGILTVVFLISAGIAFHFDNGIVFFACLILFFISFMGMVIVEPDEVRTACQTYCQEQGASYDSIKWEGEEQYCICDTSLERHLIKKNTGVIIQ